MGKGEPADEPGDDRFEARLLLSLPESLRSGLKALPSPLSVSLMLALALASLHSSNLGPRSS